MIVIPPLILHLISCRIIASIYISGTGSIITITDRLWEPSMQMMIAPNLAMLLRENRIQKGVFWHQWLVWLWRFCLKMGHRWKQGSLSWLWKQWRWRSEELSCRLFFKVLSNSMNSEIFYSFQHVVKAPRAGYVEGLKVTAGQQVFDSSVLFTIKVCGDFFYSTLESIQFPLLLLLQQS